MSIAMAFGRGGGGGVINRALKEPLFSPIRQFTLIGGTNRTRRVTGDWGQALNQKAGFPVNGVFEDSGSLRNFVSLQRYPDKNCSSLTS